jgi:uncharacterized membrane protein (DUF2068 family)
VADAHRPPGTQRPPRFRPRFHWELLVCGLRGHSLIGLDAARLRPEDAIVAREIGGVRWYRCVRCDGWLPLPPPADPARELPPAREEIQLPLRGKALRDLIVLRAIAIDRAIHVLAFGALSAAVVLFATHEQRWRATFYRIVNSIQGTSMRPNQQMHGSWLHRLAHVFELSTTTLYVVAAVAAGYAVLEAVEAVGLWYQKRWAEYLTFVATCLLLPYEIYELTKAVSVFKIGALAVNLAVAAYLLFAKRLFGLRGGGAVDERKREADVGWDVLERTAPAAPS